MNFGFVSRTTSKLTSIAVKNGSKILTCIAVGGVIGTAITTGQAVIKAHDLMQAHEMDEELKTEKYESIPEEEISGPLVYFRKRTFWEKVKLTWKCYILPITIGGTTIFCIIGAHSIDTKQKLALAAAYSLSEEAAREFRSKVTDTIGEKKVHKIDNEIEQDKVIATPLPEEDNLIFTGQGDDLMFDSWSGRYFKSTRLQVEKAVLALNKEMSRTKESISVNDYYEAIGIPYLPNACGEEFGWNYNMNSDGEDITIDFYAVFSPKQEPCTAVKIEPTLLYTYGEI